jgi:hypothetical protein
MEQPAANQQRLPPDHPPPATEVTIDPETGEVVGWSAAFAADEVEALTRICAEAQAVIKEQQRVYDAARTALERLLAERGERSVTTRFGTPSLRTQQRRSGRPERVVDTVRRYELSRDQEQLIWMCASALDARQLDELAQAGLLPGDAVADLIEAKTVSYVQVTPLRKDEQ